MRLSSFPMRMLLRLPEKRISNSRVWLEKAPKSSSVACYGSSRRVSGWGMEPMMLSISSSSMDSDKA